MKMIRLRLQTLLSEGKLVCLVYLLCYVCISSLVIQTMFELWYITILMVIVGMPLFVIKMSRYVGKRKRYRQEAEFSIFLRRLSASLAAGMTVRNAVSEIAIHNKAEYKYLFKDIERLHRQLEYNHSVCDAFADLARRCPCDDIRLFSDCLRYGIPAGVDMVSLIRYVSSSFNIKNDTRREIMQTLNLPKYNNRVMLCAPIGCLVLIKNIAPEYISPLYEGSGRIVMVIVGLLLLFAGVMGSLISDVKY